jgi:uracil-DNA glycosylase
MAMEAVFDLGASWNKAMEEELKKPYLVDLKRFLQQEAEQGYVIYPEEKALFHAFQVTPFEAVKVVIVGQDPYHGEGQAHGMAFSVKEGIKLPPSLVNIYKELQADLGGDRQENGCLEHWASQGVLLLNATLTVREKAPLSHRKKGWEKFTDRVIEKLAQKEEPIVFILWGNPAQEKCARIAIPERHLVLKAPHPSPLSAYQGFFGSKPFSKANAFLEERGRGSIHWHDS